MEWEGEIRRRMVRERLKEIRNREATKGERQAKADEEGATPKCVERVGRKEGGLKISYLAEIEGGAGEEGVV